MMRTTYTQRAHRVHTLCNRNRLHMAWALTFFVTSLGIAQSVRAQETEVVTLPDGCAAWVTVQHKDCSVEHNFTCEGDPAGVKQRIAFDEQGMTYLGATDDESQWLRSFHPLTGHSERLEESPVDPASFSELLETGIDTYDFRTLSDEIGATRFVGQDTLTGRVVSIDDVTLEETHFEITAYDEAGNEIWSANGNEYIHRDWRMFQAGPGTVILPDETYEEDDSPVEYIFPGEPGFMSINPKHGCGVVMSKSPVATLKEILNVEL